MSINNFQFSTFLDVNPVQLDLSNFYDFTIEDNNTDSVPPYMLYSGWGPLYYSNMDSVYNEEEEEYDDLSTQIDYTNKFGDLTHMSIYDALKKAGVDFKTSNPSGHRNKPIRAKNSWHMKWDPDVKGYAKALDISPIGGDFLKLHDLIVSSPFLREYFRQKGIGIIDESVKSHMAKTGATGPHFHIGPDRWAVANWQSWLTTGYSVDAQSTGYKKDKNYGIPTLKTELFSLKDTSDPYTIYIKANGSHGTLTIGGHTYEVSVGKNGVGTKRKEGDCITPSGTFSIVSLENSSSWTHNGKKVYGKTFFRLSCGNGIGIHGTDASNKLPGTEGCVRLKNEDLKIVDNYMANHGGPTKFKVVIT